MALWLTRGDRNGQHEDRFLADGRIYLTWGDAFEGQDLTGVKSQEEMREVYRQRFPDNSTSKARIPIHQRWNLDAQPRSSRSRRLITPPYKAFDNSSKE